MPARSSFDYAVVRVVPRVERGEFINVGVIVFCRTKRFLAARLALDRSRLAALDPTLDLAEVERYLAAIERVCAGGPDGGPIGQLSVAERFHWLVAPRSTVIQTSPVHSGLGDDPRAALDDIFRRLVQAPSAAGPADQPDSGSIDR